MTQTRQIHIGDVITAFQAAKNSAGMELAVDVVRKCGAQYAGTIPADKWWHALMAFNALEQSHGSATANPKGPAPERVKARWDKAPAAE